MSVAVLGCGRSGSNMILEILAGNSCLQPSAKPEDKKLFKHSSPHAENYLTKCDTVYFNEQELSQCMRLNPQMRIIWSMRDPRDMILSKLKRGQAGADVKTLADDATPQGCLADLHKMFQLYLFAEEHFSERLLLVRMEDVILDIEREAKRMCQWLSIPFEAGMLNFTARMRNKNKRQRYQSLDRGQLFLWKRWQSVYDGFFTEHDYQIPELFNQVSYLREFFNYES